MSENAFGESKGLLASLTALGATLIAIAHTRLELLSVDIEEDRQHFLSLLVLTLIALFCLGVGVVLAIILLVAVFWDTHRLLVLGVLAGCFLVAGMSAWLFAMHKSRTKPRIFTSSLSELLKDRQHLISRH
ncbi:MAG: phage holin family protein [Sulfuriferula sp.]|nr:phage holin family protein [Sulfuriferula sp.]